MTIARMVNGTPAGGEPVRTGMSGGEDREISRLDGAGSRVDGEETRGMGMRQEYTLEGARSGHDDGDLRAVRARHAAGLAAARLLDAPKAAEAHLREALDVGAGAVPAEELARWHSQLVMVLSGAAGRETELADAALRAAEQWDGLSASAATHLTFVAARACHRAGHHAEAAALFERPIAADAALYPDTEMAVLRGQYGKSLRLTGKYLDAADQFLEAARLVRTDATRTELQAELASSAASALDAGGAEDRAQVAYLRAAQLWGELGRIGPRCRCLRAAAWLRYWAATTEPEREQGLAALREVLDELTARAGDAPSPEVALELEHTHRQLADMRER